MKSLPGSRHPYWTATIVTAGFLLVISAGSRLGGDRDDAMGMTIEWLARVVVAILACVTARAIGWRGHGFSAPRTSRAWTLFLLPMIYLSVAYPLFFTGSIGPNLKDPSVTALVAAGSFSAGFAEDLVFRGLIFFTFLAAWGESDRAVWRAAAASSVFFSLPHLLNIFAGHQTLRVGAQVLWAFVLGIAIALLVFAARSVWPAAVLHGVIDAVVATNRMGRKIELTPGKAAVMVLASVPVLLYAAYFARPRPAAAENAPAPDPRPV